MKPTKRSKLAVATRRVVFYAIMCGHPLYLVTRKSPTGGGFWHTAVEPRHPNIRIVCTVEP